MMLEYVGLCSKLSSKLSPLLQGGARKILNSEFSSLLTSIVHHDFFQQPFCGDEGFYKHAI